jgi:hypothetical protein
MATKVLPTETISDDLPIGIALEMENKLAIGIGNFLIKIWFESSKKGTRTPDIIQAFVKRKEAIESSAFLKEMKGIDACYLIQLRPYKLLERIILFPSDRKKKCNGV